MSCWVGLKIAGRLLGAILTVLALQKLVGKVRLSRYFASRTSVGGGPRLAIIRVCETSVRRRGCTFGRVWLGTAEVLDHASRKRGDEHCHHAASDTYHNVPAGSPLCVF